MRAASRGVLVFLKPLNAPTHTYCGERRVRSIIGTRHKICYTRLKPPCSLLSEDRSSPNRSQAPGREKRDQTHLDERKGTSKGTESEIRGRVGNHCWVGCHNGRHSAGKGEENCTQDEGHRSGRSTEGFTI